MMRWRWWARWAGRARPVPASPLPRASPTIGPSRAESLPSVSMSGKPNACASSAPGRSVLCTSGMNDGSASLSFVQRKGFVKALQVSESVADSSPLAWLVVFPSGSSSPCLPFSSVPTTCEEHSVRNSSVAARFSSLKAPSEELSSHVRVRSTARSLKTTFLATTIPCPVLFSRPQLGLSSLVKGCVQGLGW